MHISPRRQRRILRQGLSHVVVRAVDIVVFLGARGGVSLARIDSLWRAAHTSQDAVQPVEDVLLDHHVGWLCCGAVLSLHD
jgi:hypothetical protein